MAMAMATVTATLRPGARLGHLTREWVTAVAGGIADTSIASRNDEVIGPLALVAGGL